VGHDRIHSRRREGEVMPDYTVTISGEEREDGEKPYTYVVSASSPDKAARKALIFHGPAFGLALEGIVPGVPPEDCGYYWNDLRTQMAHTPGPWHCHYLGEIAEQDVDGCLATGITTASIDEFLKEGGRGDLVAWVPHDRNEEANARLIAAAPELLAACHSLLSILKDELEDDPNPSEMTSWLDAIDEASKVIDKAEGRTA